MSSIHCNQVLSMDETKPHVPPPGLLITYLRTSKVCTREEKHDHLTFSTAHLLFNQMMMWSLRTGRGKRKEDVRMTKKDDQEEGKERSKERNRKRTRMWSKRRKVFFWNQSWASHRAVWEGKAMTRHENVKLPPRNCRPCRWIPAMKTWSFD